MEKPQIPARLLEIVEDFQWCEGREKLELLLEYAERLPPLPDWLLSNHDWMQFIPECMTPVYVYAEQENGGLRFYFDVPPEAPTVRGFATILGDGMSGSSLVQVVNVPNDFYSQLGLQDLLTAQRLNGMAAILAHMKRLAIEQLDQLQADE